jgi:hypothetical protein
MNVSAASSSLNAVVQSGLHNQQQPKPVAAKPTPPPAAPAADADGDHDGSTVGTKLSVKA